MTTTARGSCTPPVIVSGEEDDVPIYFRFYRRDDDDDEEVGGGRGLYWCVIKTKTDCCCDFSGCAYNNEKVVSPPVFKQEPSSRVYSGCVAVGGTIYVLGGLDFKSVDKPRPPNRSFVAMRTQSLPNSDVFYIDTTTTPLCGPEGGSGGGWKKLDHSMNFPRSNPHAFTVNGKIYVMGGAQPSPKPEVLDTRRMDQGWRVLQDSTDARGQITGHAVIDGGKRICLQFRRMRHLYCYDVEADSWQVHREDVLGYPMPESGLLSWKSAFLDGILYYLDKERPGVMFGVDLDSAAAAEPKRVRLPLAKSKCEDWDWIPQPVLGYSDSVLPVTHLVSLGSGKLAVLWSGRGPSDELHVYCSTIKMSKEEKKQEEEGSGGDFDLVAFPQSLSHVLVHGSSLMDCIAVKGGQGHSSNLTIIWSWRSPSYDGFAIAFVSGGHELSKSTGNVGARIACGSFVVRIEA
ncbi:hypothetical protein RHGRI_027011 [Rhododendron griersonianum]|uniref:Uncharacterized protein n=1 Tax=Rhododendron griersonianum TaxID=479676 RepID=A0AAV6IUR1_9ERIC|nr:hypothetical protein RHGRI_027011 [Rhododendron griersonianum]